jgi:hypothetical protein
VDTGQEDPELVDAARRGFLAGVKELEVETAGWW